MLADYFNNRFTLQRNVQDGRKTYYATVANRVAGHIQPVSMNYLARATGQFKVTHMLLTEFEDIRIGDNIICEGVLYKAIGVQAHTFRTGRRHTDVMLESSGIITKPDIVGTVVVPATYSTLGLSPVLTTLAGSGIGTTSFTANGEVTEANGLELAERGFVYKTGVGIGQPGNVAPNLSGYTFNTSQMGSYGAGAYAIAIGGVQASTTYRVRAYVRVGGNYYYAPNEVVVSTTGAGGGGAF